MFIEDRKLSESEVRQIDPLLLAYIGDVVFEMYVRERIIFNNMNLKSNDIHKKAINYAKASSQSGIMEFLEETLTDEEIYFYKRGRNSKSNHIPKNAVVVDYKRATGFEALIGYLYLTNNVERLNEILEISAKIIEEKLFNETK